MIGATDYNAPGFPSNEPDWEDSPNETGGTDPNGFYYMTAAIVLFVLLLKHCI